MSTDADRPRAQIWTVDANGAPDGARWIIAEDEDRTRIAMVWASSAENIVAAHNLAVRRAEARERLRLKQARCRHKQDFARTETGIVFRCEWCALAFRWDGPDGPNLVLDLTNAEIDAELAVMTREREAR